MSELPTRPVIAAFKRGVTPQAIADGFGTDVRDVVDTVIAELREEGRSDDEIAEMFGRCWL